MKSNNLLMKNRRKFLKRAGILLAGLPIIQLIGWSKLASAEMPKVSEDDPVAVSLKYVHDASKAAGRNNSEAFCHNCQLYTGEADSEWGPCSIFPGKVVNANGWCSAWVKKAG